MAKKTFLKLEHRGIKQILAEFTAVVKKGRCDSCQFYLPVHTPEADGAPGDAYRCAERGNSSSIVFTEHDLESSFKVFPREGEYVDWPPTLSCCFFYVPKTGDLVLGSPETLRQVNNHRLYLRCINDAANLHNQITAVISGRAWDMLESLVALLDSGDYQVLDPLETFLRASKGHKPSHSHGKAQSK